MQGRATNVVRPMSILKTLLPRPFPSPPRKRTDVHGLFDGSSWINGTLLNTYFEMLRERSLGGLTVASYTSAQSSLRRIWSVQSLRRTKKIVYYLMPCLHLLHESIHKGSWQTSPPLRHNRTLSDLFYTDLKKKKDSGAGSASKFTSSVSRRCVP